jgi:hypothetical protein
MGERGETTVQVTAPRAPAARPGVAVAGVASIAAGLVHAAAAGNHEGDATLVWMFALCAAAQLLWGVVAIVTIQPARPVLLAGLVINGGAVVVWALSRTVGIPFVGVLAEVESVGRQDLGAALFAAVSVLAICALLVRPQRAPRLAFGWVGGLAVVALLAALPAMSAEHAHEHGGGGHANGDHAHEEAGAAHDDDHEHEEGSEDGHGHAEGEDHADGEDHGDHDDGDGDGHADHDDADGDGHAHGDLASTGGHGHGGDTGGNHGHAPGDPAHPHPTDPDDPHPHPTDPDDPHPHPTDPDDPDDPDPHPHPTDPDDPIISLDDPRLTEDQFNIAIGIVISTTSGMASFQTEEDVLAAGYTSIGDGGAPGQYTHYINWSLVGDAHELDPTRIESIVMKMNADGTTRVVAAMYILTTGDTMADAPPLAGELTTWHDHDNLCFVGGAFAGLAVGGVCPVGVLGDTPPMLHVWVEANPCGPFAEVDENGQDCGAPHGH